MTEIGYKTYGGLGKQFRLSIIILLGDHGKICQKKDFVTLEEGFYFVYWWQPEYNKEPVNSGYVGPYTFRLLVYRSCIGVYHARNSQKAHGG